MVKFKCPVDSDPRANITWWKEGVLVDENLADTEVKRNSMSITDLEVEDRGHYMCHAANDYGEVKVNFTLTVIPYENGESQIIPAMFLTVECKLFP